MDLEALDREQLLALRNSVDKAITIANGRRRREAVAAAEEAAQRHGFKLSELIGGHKALHPRADVGIARYGNPDNPSQTWTGRGRRPGWVSAAIDAGRSLDDFAL